MIPARAWPSLDKSILSKSTPLKSTSSPKKISKISSKSCSLTSIAFKLNNTLMIFSKSSIHSSPTNSPVTPIIWMLESKMLLKISTTLNKSSVKSLAE